MRKLILGLLLIAAPTSLYAMDVETFLQKADALKKRGALALFSKDFGLLKNEVVSAGKDLRAEQAAAVKAGRKPTACPPDKARVNSDELLAHFSSIPPAQRPRTQVRDAFRSLMVRKYPCPG